MDKILWGLWLTLLQCLLKDPCVGIFPHLISNVNQRTGKNLYLVPSITWQLFIELSLTRLQFGLIYMFVSINLMVLMKWEVRSGIMPIWTDHIWKILTYLGPVAFPCDTLQNWIGYTGCGECFVATISSIYYHIGLMRSLISWIRWGNEVNKAMKFFFLSAPNLEINYIFTGIAHVLELERCNLSGYGHNDEMVYE